jgi:very-short-patch-repair endonuclease
MSRDWIVRGARVSGAKAEAARQLRLAQTPEESLLWEKLRSNRLGGFHFRRQQVIRGFIVDFYCHSASLVLEIDGSIHDEQGEEDAARDQILAELGLCVVHIRNDALHVNMDRVLEKILHRCQIRNA